MSLRQMQGKETTMNLNFENTAYDPLYLEDMMSVHGLMFFKLVTNMPEYDVFSMIDTYMRYSEVRYKMDLGNWSALNKGWKQLFNSIDFSLCEPKTRELFLDQILLGWIADIYVLLQWRYNIPSAEISRRMPAETLCGMYNPLHETSYENACEKLHHRFLEGREIFMDQAIRSFSGEHYFLSNFYEAPVLYDGITYKNSEAAFQAQKCADQADRQKFAGLNATEARHLGREIILRRDWERVKMSLMREIVQAKFMQNPRLAELLLATDDAYLEEGNTWGDRTWGTVDGIGANHLGRILMEVREELRTLKKLQEMPREEAEEPHGERE